MQQPLCENIKQGIPCNNLNGPCIFRHIKIRQYKYCKYGLNCPNKKWCEFDHIDMNQNNQHLCNINNCNINNMNHNLNHQINEFNNFDNLSNINTDYYNNNSIHSIDNIHNINVNYNNDNIHYDPKPAPSIPISQMTEVESKEEMTPNNNSVKIDPSSMVATPPPPDEPITSKDDNNKTNNNNDNLNMINVSKNYIKLMDKLNVNKKHILHLTNVHNKHICLKYMKNNCNKDDCKYYHPKQCIHFTLHNKYNCNNNNECNFAHIMKNDANYIETDNIDNNNSNYTNTIDINSMKNLSTPKDSSVMTNNTNTIQTKKKRKRKSKNKNQKQNLQDNGLSLHNNNNNNKNNNNKSMKTLNNDSNNENKNNDDNDSVYSDYINYVKPTVNLDTIYWEFKHFINKLDTDLTDYKSKKYQILEYFCTFKQCHSMILPTIIYFFQNSSEYLKFTNMQWHFKEIIDLANHAEYTEAASYIIIPFLKYFKFIYKTGHGNNNYYFDDVKIDTFLSVINKHFNKINYDNFSGIVISDIPVSDLESS